MNYLGFCCILKNEDEDYIREWIDYHLQIGVEKIILYDNGSSIPLEQTIAVEEYGRQVQVVNIPGEAMQLAAYLHCLHTYGSEFRWIGFIDLDEFIYPKETQDLALFLREFEAYAALGIHWQLFGSSGHEEKPGASQIMGFTQRVAMDSEINHPIKCIVNPAQTIFPLGPHFFLFAENGFCVNEQHETVPACYPRGNEVVANRIQVNHYRCRSRMEYRQKITRGWADGGQVDPRSWKDFEDINAFCVEEDLGLLELWENLQKIPPKTPAQARANKPYCLTPSGLHISIRERIQMVKEDAARAAQPDKLLLALQVLSRYFPPAIGNHLLASQMYHELGNPGIAWEELEKARKLEPFSPEVINQMGRFLYGYHQLDEAEKAFKLVLQAHPQNEEALLSLGKIFFDTGRLQEAFRILKIASQIYPENYDIRTGLQEIQKAMGV